MTDKDKNLKSFLENNTKSELKKPINEFSEILGKIEDKPASIFKLPRWFYATAGVITICLLYTSPSPRDATLSRMPSSA